jgi:hypothetical protein
VKSLNEKCDKLQISISGSVKEVEDIDLKYCGSWHGIVVLLITTASLRGCERFKTNDYK